MKTEVETNLPKTFEEQKEMWIAQSSAMEDAELRKKVSELRKLVKEKNTELEVMANNILEDESKKPSNRAYIFMRKLNELDKIKTELRIFKDELTIRRKNEEKEELNY